MKDVKNGFTLVELLVVISIIALLLSILMPGLQKARQAGWRVVCASRLRTIGLAAELYIGDNSKYLPYAYYDRTLDSSAVYSAGGWCWPGAWAGKYIGLEKYTRSDGFWTEGWKEIAAKYFSCPARAPYRGLPCYGYEHFSYGMNVNFGTTIWYIPRKKQSEAKRPSTVIMHLDMEGDGTNGAAFYLTGQGWDALGYSYRHSNSLNILFLDGHVNSFRDVPSSASDWAF